MVIEKDFWRCVEEGPGMRILRCSDGVNCMVCDMDQVGGHSRLFWDLTDFLNRLLLAC